MDSAGYAAAIAAFNRTAELAEWPMRADEKLDFSVALLRDALSVWRERAGVRTRPTRSDMSPRAMKGFLPNLAIIEANYLNGRTRFRSRITGTELARTFGHETDYFDRFVPEPFLSRWEALMRLTLEVDS